MSYLLLSSVLYVLITICNTIPSRNQILGSLDGEMNNAQKAKNVFLRLRLAFQRVPGAKGAEKYALRMTKASHNCINFHCDGIYATSTSQIPLNEPSEYKGGKLCYFVNDQLHFVPRTPGSLVQHPPKGLHGVTRVTEGTRKSFFIVDSSNGLGRSLDNDVVQLEAETIVSFLASMSEKRDCKPSAADHIVKKEKLGEDEIYDQETDEEENGGDSTGAGGKRKRMAESKE